MRWRGENVRCVALLIALLSILPANGPAFGRVQRASGPSFSCAGRLSPTEALICGDSELGAYDRAIALTRVHRRHSSASNIADRLGWLRRRNACGQQRGCVLDAYKDRLGDLDAQILVGPSLRRIGIPPPDGSDLMLGTLQSPRGRVRRLSDSAALHIRALGGDWYLFQANAGHVYDPGDRMGASLSTSEASGLVHLQDGNGVFVEDPAIPDSCAVRFTRLPRGAWRLVEIGTCSGLGSSLTGIYGR